jgi:RNA polymerase sigma-70 factor (ECF subfamily)
MGYTDSDRERFERIFRANHLKVHAFARRRVAAEAVDDVVSETFTVAWRRLDDIPDDPLPWLLGVARNVVGTARRGEARRMRLQTRAQAEYHAAPSDEGQPKVDGALVTAALERLNERDREALTLVGWEGLTPTEAAMVIGIPANRFRVRLHRAARRLRWALDATEAEADAAAQQQRLNSDFNSQGAVA